MIYGKRAHRDPSVVGISRDPARPRSERRGTSRTPTGKSPPGQGRTGHEAVAPRRWPGPHPPTSGQAGLVAGIQLPAATAPAIGDHGDAGGAQGAEITMDRSIRDIELPGQGGRGHAAPCIEQHHDCEQTVGAHPNFSLEISIRPLEGWGAPEDEQPGDRRSRRSQDRFPLSRRDAGRGRRRAPSGATTPQVPRPGTAPEACA